MTARRKRSRLKPCLILVMGVAGSGKTTLAQGILRHISAVYLDNNYIADAFFPHARNGAAYEKLRPGFYKALYKIAEENLKLGNSVLLDAPHIKEVQTPEWRAYITGLARRTKAKLIVIRCLCPEKVLWARICSRNEQRDHWKLDNWGAFLEEQPINVSIPLPHLEIDAEKNLTKNVKAAINYLKGRLRPQTRFRGGQTRRPQTKRETAPSDKAALCGQVSSRTRADECQASG